jgi:hypothetical protein
MESGDVHTHEAAGDHVADIGQRNHVQFFDEAIVRKTVEAGVPKLLGEVLVLLIVIRAEFRVCVQHFRREAPAIRIEGLYEEIAVIIFLVSFERLAIVE